MPRLLAAERRARGCSISSITYLSPTGHADHLDAAVAQRDLEADVAHDGRDDGVALQPAAGLHVPAHISSTASPSTIAPVRIDEDRAIAVAVEGDAHPAALRRAPARQRLGMRRAAVEVDVAAVGLVAEHVDVEAEVAETAAAPPWSSRRWPVDRELETARGAPGSGSAQPRVREVRVDDIDLRRPARPPSPAPPSRPSATIASTSRSSARVNFSPRPENTLMPLSSNGLCEAEMTSPASKPIVARDVGDRRRRHHAGAA